MPLDRTWLTPLVDDSGSGTDGSIIDKQLFLDFADDVDQALLTAGGGFDPTMGQWTAVPFNAAHYTASPSGSWTVPAGQAFLYYTLIGKTCCVVLYINAGTTVAGSPTGLKVQLPAGLVALQSTSAASLMQNGGWQLGAILVSNGSSQLTIHRSNLSAFANDASTGGYFSVTFPIV